MSAPRRVRLPPQTLRVTTAGREEHGLEFAGQVPGEALGGGQRRRGVDEPAEPGFEPSAGRREAVLADAAGVAAGPQGEGVLQDRLHGGGPGAVGMIGPQVLAAPQQMRQAGLVGRVLETAIRHPSVPHQHAREVGAEHRRRVGEPAAGADGVDRRLRGGERPQPVAGRVHAPAGLVGRDHRAAADLLAQRRIRGRGRVGRAVQQSDQAAFGHVQSEPGPQHAGGLPQRQARLGVQFGGQRGDVRPPLHAGRAERIGGLQGVPALHAPPALRATAHLDVEAAHQGAHVRHVFLILRRHPLHGDGAAAVRARLRGGRRMGLVHPGRRSADQRK